MITEGYVMILKIQLCNTLQQSF